MKRGIAPTSGPAWRSKVTDFVLNNANAATEQKARERAILILSAGETEALVHALLEPPEPGPVLLAAAQRYKDFVEKLFAG